MEKYRIKAKLSYGFLGLGKGQTFYYLQKECKIFRFVFWIDIYRDSWTTSVQNRKNELESFNP